MKTHVKLLLSVMLLASCRQSTNQIVDQTITVRGVVQDSKSFAPIESVIVGWKVHTYPDSELFPNGEIRKDSIIFNYSVHDLQGTNSNGSFVFQVFLAPKPPYPYEDMFACKKGYSVWHYNREEDRVISIDQYTDSLIIKLQKL